MKNNWTQFFREANIEEITMPEEQKARIDNDARQDLSKRIERLESLVKLLSWERSASTESEPIDFEALTKRLETIERNVSNGMSKIIPLMQEATEKLLDYRQTIEYTNQKIEDLEARIKKLEV